MTRTRRVQSGRPAAGPGTDESRLPDFVRPMLAQTAEPFDSARHLFEIKWDGARCLAFIEPRRMRLVSRRGLDVQQQYPELAGLSQLPAGTVLDGEVVVLEEGKPSLARLQQRAQLSNPARIEILSKRRPVTLMVFDLLYLRYKNVMAQPLIDRRGQVQELIERLGTPHLMAPSYVLEHGRHYFAEIERHGLEGVMAKRLDSAYSPGRRLPDWLKIKVATYLRRTTRSKQRRAIAQP